LKHKMEIKTTMTLLRGILMSKRFARKYLRQPKLGTLNR
jgi:hypothetical protein